MMDRQAWDQRYAGDDLLWSGEPNRVLVDEIDDLPAGRALDLACGEGRNAVWLAEQGWRVTGVDFSGVALEKAHRLAAARGVDVEWVLADVVDYSPVPASYDLVAVFFLHLPAGPRHQVFARAAQAVAPGGTLLVVAHDSTNLAAGWGGPPNPAVLYGPDDVIADVTGLEVVRAERVERAVVTDEGPKTAIDVVVRAIHPQLQDPPRLTPDKSGDWGNIDTPGPR